MTTVSITKIQLRRGPASDLPGAGGSPGLDEGELGYVTDMGRLFVGVGADPARPGMPNYNRTTFPFGNIEVFTENTPLQTIFGAAFADNQLAFLQSQPMVQTATFQNLQTLDPATNTVGDFHLDFRYGASVNLSYFMVDSQGRPFRQGTLTVLWNSTFVTAPLCTDTAQSLASDYASIQWQAVLTGASGQQYVALQYINQTGDTPKIYFRVDRPSDVFQSSGGTIPASLEVARFVTIYDFGAKGDGSTDDTAAFQNALDSGAPLIMVPPSANGYVVGSLVMPTTPGFVLQGCGTAGFLKMKAGSVLTWPSGSVAYIQGAVRNLAIDGTNGTGHCIDTSYAGGIDLDDIYIKNIPAGCAGIRINGDAVHSTYTHDVAVRRVRIYDNGAGGAAGILLDEYAADVEVTDAVMNLNFVTPYCLKVLPGCGSVQVTDGHLYNAKTSIANIATANEMIRFNGVTLDHAQGGDLVDATGTVGLLFDGCRFQAVQTGYNGLSLTNCLNTKVLGCAFDAASGAVSAVVETGSSDYTVVSNPDISSGSYADLSSPFVLIGANSLIRGAYRDNLYGYFLPYSFVGQAQLLAGQTMWYGPNGQRPSAAENSLVVPINSLLQSCAVYCDTAPGTGQSFTVTLYVQGAAVATGTISGGAAYGVTLSIPANTSLTAGNVVTLSVTSSSSTATAFIRGAITLTA